MFASKTTRAFYDPEIHSSMPEDVVEISSELHAQLLAGEGAGKIIDWDDSGFPALIERPAASLGQLRGTAWESIKAERDRRTLAGIQVGSNWVHSDLFSRSQWLGLKDSARDVLVDGGGAEDILRDKDGGPISWKMLNGSFVVVTVQMAFDVVAAVMASDMAIFTMAEQHRAAVMVSQAPADYDYTGNWPTTYAEWVVAQEAI